MRLTLILSCGLVLSCSSGKPAPVGGTTPQPVASARPPDPREAALSEAVVELLERQHLRKRPLDDKVSREAFDRYLKDLDASKMFLLKGDAERLEPYANRIDDQIHDRRLDLAHQGAALYAKRVEVVEKMVSELLAKPFVHSDEETVEVDPDKLELCATEEELRERWRRRLELEVLERVQLMEDRAAGTAPQGDSPVPPPREPPPPTFEGKEAKARADLAKSYAARFVRLRTPGPLDDAATLINAVMAIYDPHTNYLPPADKANFDIQMSGSLEGIGAVLREDDHYIRVVELVPGGASWRQGQLEQGDLILSVQQEGKEAVDVADMRIDEVVKMIRGPKGTVVTLVVQKPTDEVLTIAITRDVVVIEDAYAKGAMLQTKRTKAMWGYIALPSFYGGQRGPARSAAADVRRLLVEMQKRKAPGVVIDLRQNGGGLLGDAVEMTGLLIDKGPVVQTQKSDGDRDVLSDDDSGTTYAGPIVLMVDRFSASASEIVAGALQDYKRVVVLGTGPTHGKGTVQILSELGELGVLKLTVQQFFRVNGASTQAQGVMPDIVLPDPNGHLETGERELEHHIPPSQIDPVPHAKWAVTWNLADLVAKSGKRVTGSDVFSKIASRNRLLTARRDDSKVPLKRDAWLAQRKEQKAALDAVSPDLDKGPARFGVTVIDYDGSKPVGARPGGKTDDRATKWRENLGRDPWLEEALYVLTDMAGPGPH